ncbi:hypothetical protein DPMN_158159 [Dreissena polymorpha]|uniref:Uncharacterized protein n=1 Tax=Dreissena polymorpha TaxID=45954 RepID=A0A9D4EIL0_DREPO|nr:hypothetical protein DPMN_158159 [Dreissena polymorpha]
MVSCYMRYASFLDCNNAACEQLDQVENEIKEHKQPSNVCECFNSPMDSLILTRTAQQLYSESFKQINYIFMAFRAAEAICVPMFLLYEFNRRYIETTTPSGLPKPCNTHYDCASVHIKPFIYYLPYLTYRKLYQKTNKNRFAPKSKKAFNEIKSYIEMAIGEQNNTRFRKHFDTSLNMLRHCYEMEGKSVLAMQTYTTSLQWKPKQNEAVLHMIRLRSMDTDLGTFVLKCRNDSKSHFYVMRHL